MSKVRVIFSLFMCAALLRFNYLTRVASAVNAAAQDHTQNSADEPLVRTATNLVTLNVTVKDSMGNLIGGLTPENFRIYDEGVEQRVEHCYQSDQPVTVGVILDTSHSMKERIDVCRDSIREFLRGRITGDQFFLFSFNTTVVLERDFTDSVDSINAALLSLQTEGLTALNDAIYLGLRKARQGRYARRALLLVTDGDDTNSKCKVQELRTVLRESDVQIYSVGITGQRRLSKEGRKFLTEVAESSGGIAFFPQSKDEIRSAVEAIGVDLRSQYALSFIPSSPPSGRWHPLKVTVKSPAAGSLSVRTRKGYFY